MFSASTAKFIYQIDPEGSLIHVSRLNNSHKLVPMAAVVKRKRFWFWQRPKYQPTDFTLSDLLLGDQPLIPDVLESEFLTYEGTFGNMLGGKLSATAGSMEVNMEGKGSSRLQSSFGKLKREELNVKKLLCDSNNRLINMQHMQVQQMQKRSEVLAILRERILTTSHCSISETRHKQLGCLGALGLSTVKVSLKDTNTMDIESNVSVEIPPDTVIAYSILELQVKIDGHYVFCLQPGTVGGFEANSSAISPSLDSHHNISVVDGPEGPGGNVQQRAPLSIFHEDFQEVETYLSSLSGLPESERWIYFQKLQEILRDRTSLSFLEDRLEDWCRGEMLLPLAQLQELVAPHLDCVTTVLDLIYASVNIHSTSVDTEANGFVMPALITAAHLLVSALEVFADENLLLLSKCCPDVLQALDILLLQLLTNDQPLSLRYLPIILWDNKVLSMAQQLFGAANVVLRRDGGTLQAETWPTAHISPLILCVAVRGLALLCRG